MLKGGSTALLASFLLATASTAGDARAQTAPPPLSLSALVDQTVALHPRIQGEVVDVQGSSLTLTVSRRTGARPGLALEVFREGREIRHPRTGQVLGRMEHPLGRAVITQVAEGYSVAEFDGTPAEPIKIGDRVRTSSGKVKLTLLTLAGPGVRPNLVEAAVQEVYAGLSQTGRFHVVLGDRLALWLGEQKIGPEAFLSGQGVAEAAARFGAENILAVHFRPVQRRPFMDVRLFSAGRPEAALTMAFFVPPSIKPVQPGRFSASDRPETPAPERKRPSLLARLLGWGLEPGTYSSGESTIPLREIARFPFVVGSLDVAVAPADGTPRLAVTDGERVYLYRLVERELQPEWTFSARSLARVISVQLAELTGDGMLEVVVNRFDTRVGMSSLVIGVPGGRPEAIVENIDAILLAVDDTGAGVRRTLWAQRYREETFFARGQAEEVKLRDGTLVTERRVIVPDAFRATGAAFSNIMGQERRALVFIDEQNRLRVTRGAEEVWRSSSAVGGGNRTIVVERGIERGGRSFFYRMEPTPLAVDLDGDGVEEVVVPQNEGQQPGLLAVIYRGPAGLRFQSVNSGFEGTIPGLGAVPSGDGSPPALIAAVIRYGNLFKTSGETQIIMAVQE